MSTEETSASHPDLPDIFPKGFSEAAGLATKGETGTFSDLRPLLSTNLPTRFLEHDA